MRSPFAIFRKHQKTLMVATVGLAMFAFIILGSIEQAGGLSGQGSAVLLGVLLGAVLVGLFGIQSGKPGNWAMIGAAVGGLAGFAAFAFVPDLTGQAEGVETRAGNLSPREIDQLVRKRQIANQFVRQAFEAGNPFPAAMDSQQQQFQDMMMRFWQQRLQRHLFRIDPRRDVDQDVVLGYLLRHEARRLGIIVTTEVVSKRIEQISKDMEGNSISRRQYRKLLRNFGLSESELYAVLQDEILAQMALNVLAPQDPKTPHEYWLDFRKLNVSQKLVAVPVPVDEFTSKVDEPPDAELRSFFENPKDRFPGEGGPGAPGFKQPRRVRLAYVEADYETIEGEVDEVTDEDITAFYEENKDTLYQLPSPSQEDQEDAESASDADEGGPELQLPLNKSEDEDEKPDAAKSDAANRGESADASKSEKENGEVSENGADDGTAPSERSGAEEDDRVQDSAPGDKPESPDAPDGEAENGEARTDDSSESANDSESTDGPDNGDADSGTDKSPGASAAVRPDNNPAAYFASVSDSEDEPAETDDAETDDAETEQAETEQAETEQAETEQAETDQAETDQAETDEPGQDESPKPAEPQYRPLDDELKSQIRDQLLRQRTLDEMESRIAKAQSKMDDLSYRVEAPETDANYISEKKASELLRKFAEEQHLVYRQTGWLSYTELRESQEHPIGSAVEPSADPRNQQNARPVHDLLFSSESIPLYIPKQAVDPVTRNRFCYWPVGEQQVHVPEFDEVKKEVLEAWKLQQARAIARQRAEEVAEQVRKSLDEDKAISDVVTKLTVTGDQDGLQFSEPLETSRFSWLSRTSPSASQPNPFQPQPIRLTQIPGIEKAGNEFMKTVFQKLEDGEVGVVPNADRTVYYVVQVKDRLELKNREDFMSDDLFSPQGPYSSLVSSDQREAYFAWLDGLEKRYAVRWNQRRR